MAVLEKIRVKFGILITVLVALALLSFILDPSTLRNFMQMASNDNKVGEMAGKSISYKDFYEEFDNFSKLAEMSGQNVNDENAQQELRNAAWQEIFDENVFLPTVEKAGVAVGDAEMFDLTQGSQISPLLLQQMMFCDEQGNFNRAALAQFVQAIDNDETGNSAAYWNFLEKSVYKSQLYEKYASLIQGATLQNNIEKARAIVENNTTVDVDYVMVPVMTFGEDSTVNVSRDEIKAYYNERKDGMKQVASRDIRYVMLEVVPSQEDYTDTKAQFDELYEQFKTAENLKNFIALNSDAKWDSYYYKESELESMPNLKSIFNAGKDVTSDVLAEETSFTAARVADRVQMSDSVQVFYSVFPIDQDAAADSALAVVRKNGKSADMAELGWFTQEAAVANGLSEFLPVFLTTEKAVKIKVLNAQAIFVLYLQDRTKPVTKVQFATLVKNVLPSESTYTDFMIKATDIADKTGGKASNLEAAAEEMNVSVLPLKSVTEATRRIGDCANARELVRWIFDKKTKVGSVSDVIVVDNKYYFVAAVDRIRKEGQTELRDIAGDIRTILTAQKKVAAMKDEVAGKIAGCSTLEDVAEALGQTVSHSTGISFGSQYQQLDNKLVGAIANAKPDVISGPVAGEYGVYVYKVSNSNEGTFFTEEDAANVAAQKAGYLTQVFEKVLSDKADVKDYRARFF